MIANSYEVLLSINQRRFIHNKKFSSYISSSFIKLFTLNTAVDISRQVYGAYSMFIGNSEEVYLMVYGSYIYDIHELIYNKRYYQS